jgi:hypothetical protein
MACRSTNLQSLCHGKQKTLDAVNSPQPSETSCGRCNALLDIHQAGRGDGNPDNDVEDK